MPWPRAKNALSKGQSPPQELEVSRRSGLYLLVKIYINSFMQFICFYSWSFFSTLCLPNYWPLNGRKSWREDWRESGREFGRDSQTKPLPPPPPHLPFWMLVHYETLVIYFSNSQDRFISLTYVKTVFKKIGAWHQRSRLSFTTATKNPLLRIARRSFWLQWFN